MAEALGLALGLLKGRLVVGQVVEVKVGNRSEEQDG